MIDFKQMELEVREFWKKKNIQEKLEKKNKGKKKYFLLDGPPYANFIPHVGHIKNTVFKDMLIRIALMKGYDVLFQPGFDTHGLPVENMVEQKLGLKSKKDIETLGVGKFMDECKKSATENKGLWMDAYRKLGSMYDGKKPYLTYEDYYIDSAWWAFSEMYKKSLVYEGEKPVMWCPHCETSLAGYEVTDSYKELTDPGVYVLFKLKDTDGHILVFTTTPWTLPANVAIAVAPKEDYVLVDISGKKVIIAKERLQKISDMGFGYSILKEFKGKELVGKKYEPLLDVPLQRELEKGKLGKAHEIISSISILKERVSSKMRTKKGLTGKDVFEEFVTVNEGTGFVHTAPGHGKTDNVVGQHYGLACVSPVDDKAHFKEESGFSGFVKSADKEIIQRLEDEGKLLFKEQVKHSYPLCWRCKTPLIYRLSKQLFFKIEDVKKKILKENTKVSWYPEYAKDRFENWVENAEDWNISRQRYWGTPIPLWESDSGETIVVSGRKELEKLSGKKINDVHDVDKIVIEKNGEKFKKVRGILDVWFDSGVAPFASLGYPWKNKELFEGNFPVSRINEAQDQIRGWFYSLMFCSAAVFGKQAYKEVSMTGWVLDKKGDKMSKSQGNVMTADEALEKVGADVLRYYFCWDLAPYETQKFNLDIAQKEVGKILNVLWNLQNLVKAGKVKVKDATDKWILSRLESVTKDYSEKLDEFEYGEAFREISNFILNDLSRGYIQMNRESEKGEIIGYCLERVLKLLAPVSLFICEKIWQNIKEKKIVTEESVHLSEWPKVNEKKINKKLEKEFELAMKVIELGLRERDKVQIGLKWPLGKAEIICDGKISSEIQEIIAKQINVKKIVIRQGKEIQIKLDIKMTKELEAEGFAREITRKVQSERKEAGLKKGELIDLCISCSEKLQGMLKPWLLFLKERTNSKTLKFVADLRDGKKSFTVKEEQITVGFS